MKEEDTGYRVFTLPSYKVDSCHCDCKLLGNKLNQKCWGNVNCVDEEEDEVGQYFFPHLCEGHMPEYYKYGPYKQSDRKEDL